MRTEIEHRYQFGFVLTEQELRRIVQSCQEHALKLGANDALRVITKLKDGSLIESNRVDDVLEFENGGQKAITRLFLICDDGHERSSCYIKIQFEDGTLNPRSWDSISISVAGESRDAVFVAAADLDDRIKKTQIRAWPYLSSRQWFFLIPFFVSITLVAFGMQYFSPTYSAVEQVQIEYDSGRLVDPIEAMLLLERLKTTRYPGTMLLVIGIPFAVSFAVFSMFRHAIEKYSLSYVFYWGDVIAKYERHRNATRVFWTVIVLGVLASVTGGWILRILS